MLRNLSPSRIMRLVGMLLLLLIALAWMRRESPPRPVALEVEPPLAIPGGARDSYTTNFSAPEKPIVEGGKWVSGKASGIDWTDVTTDVGLAHGTESGTRKGAAEFDDSTALLAGTWKPDQTVEAEVHSVNQTDTDFEEVELRLRSTLTNHNSTGYEVLFRCSKSPNAYASIVRWDGRLGVFTYLTQKKGPQYGVADGDVVKATVIGNVITGYINNVPVIQTTDNTYTSGSPGMGFWLRKSSSKLSGVLTRSGQNTDCGFRRLAAWD